MTAGRNSEIRHVLPRWRSFTNAVAGGELRFVRQDDPLDLSQGLDVAEDDWDANRSLVYAAEFAGAAITAGVPGRARETVDLLRQAGGPHELLGNVVERGIGTRAVLLDNVILGTGESALRSSLVRDPRNSLGWLDLARLQFANGHVDAATKSVLVALQLAPHHRYVLRSAATFYVEIGSPDRAAKLLQLPAVGAEDPWLTAAEIAVSSLAERKSKLIKKAKNNLESERWDGHSSSELSAEIATLEASAGSVKLAKRFFRGALSDPTENSLAQVVFVSLRDPGIVPEVKIAVDSSLGASEASARQAEARSEFNVAAREAAAWLSDQPFSLDAATYASYITTEADNGFELAAVHAKNGLKVHPNDPLLHNNLAYALIESGHLVEAGSAVTMAERLAGKSDVSAVISATRGLLDYRMGDSDGGWANYTKAAAAARRLGRPDLEATALTMHAREALAIEDATAMLAKAVRLGAGTGRVLKALIERTTLELSNRQSVVAG